MLPFDRHLQQNAFSSIMKQMLFTREVLIWILKRGSMNILSNIQNTISQWVGDPLSLLFRLLAILLALTVHEWAHAFSAYKCGDPTARSMGRMTLNPLKHIDPVGFICLIFLGFGWAKPVPVNPNNYNHGQRDSLIVSLSGVATNLVFAFVSVFAYVLTLLISVNSSGSAVAMQYVNTFFMYLASINLSLMAFNLLPVPPLDGWNAVKTLLVGRINLNWIWGYERYGNIVLMILLITGLVGRILSPIVYGIFNGFLSFWLWVFF